ncbi:MAG: cyclase family protein [Candidatus Caldarchaeum sp.]|nr:cyclase family protein [Candidatus Caldarchaeum sp.]
MWVLLSHKLSITTPSYDDGPKLEFWPFKQISRGDRSNSFLLKLYNHLGTHVDAPNHFDPNGRKIASYTAEELVFSKPVLIDLSKKEGELITRQELEPYVKTLSSADILLLRTGFQVYRESRPEVFMKRGPCLSAGAAEFLRGFRGLKALGVDMISISSPVNREQGREAHRILLTERSFLIVEDMDLQGKPSEYRRLILSPLMVEELDSAPCTVFAEV